MWERFALGENSTGKGRSVETGPGLCLHLSKSADVERVRAPTNGAWGDRVTRPLQRLFPISAKGDLLGLITG